MVCAAILQFASGSLPIVGSILHMKEKGETQIFFHTHLEQRASA